MTHEAWFHYNGLVAAPLMHAVGDARVLVVDWPDSAPDVALVSKGLLFEWVNEINEHRKARPSSAEGTPT